MGKKLSQLKIDFNVEPCLCINFFFFQFGRQRQKEGAIFHLLIHFTMAAMTRQCQGARDPTQVSKGMGGAQGLASSFIRFPGSVTGSWIRSRARYTVMWNAGVGSHSFQCLSHCAQHHSWHLYLDSSQSVLSSSGVSNQVKIRDWKLELNGFFFCCYFERHHFNEQFKFVLLDRSLFFIHISALGRFLSVLGLWILVGVVCWIA